MKVTVDIGKLLFKLYFCFVFAVSNTMVGVSIINNDAISSTAFTVLSCFILLFYVWFSWEGI